LSCARAIVSLFWAMISRFSAPPRAQQWSERAFPLRKGRSAACRPRRAREGCRRRPQAWAEPATAQFVVPHEQLGRFEMLKGGLLWLIGIPLPIILILFFLGYLS
jgi:hypothetical protein